MKEIIEINGDRFYLDNGKLHNDNLPAIEYANGICWFLKNGKLHRENDKAIIGNKEVTCYWVNGEVASEEEIKNIKRNKIIDEIL